MTKPKRKPKRAEVAEQMAATTLAAWKAQGQSLAEQKRRITEFARRLDVAEKRRVLRGRRKR